MSAPRSGFAALLGWTNVGKSTLLNRLVGVKLAAVADVAQTTRHRIVGARTDPEGGQILFVDTPGLHEPRHRMNRAMVETARQSLAAADVVLLVVDAARGLGPGDREAVEALGARRAESILVLNKVDLVRPKERLLPLMAVGAGELGFAEVVPVSAKTGEGCDALIAATRARLPESPPLYPDDYLTDQPERLLAAEWIREKLLRETRQELPHATAVRIDGWEEREDGLLAIEASILVERDSHKKIVIGKGGGLLKRVGIAAREELEAFLERRVYLRLWVQVRPDWRNREGILRDLGIGG